MLNFIEYALKDLHKHRDFRSTYLCYLNHIHDCRKQNDAEALKLQITMEFLTNCDRDYKLLLEKRVPDAVRAGAADLLASEVDFQVDAAKDELGHHRPSITAQAPNKFSSNALHSMPSELCEVDDSNIVITSTTPVGSPPRLVEESETVQVEHALGQIKNNSAGLTSTAPLQDSVESPCTVDTQKKSVQVGHKHPRDRLDDDNALQTKIPRSTAPPSPPAILIHHPAISTGVNERGVSQDEEDEDKDKDVGCDEDGEPPVQPISGISAERNHKQLRRISFIWTWPKDRGFDSSSILPIWRW